MNERLDANGTVINPLDSDSVAPVLQQAWSNGIRSVAIVLMHAYINPLHERQLAELAESIGFTQVSTSHQTSRLIKLVGRGDETAMRE